MKFRSFCISVMSNNTVKESFDDSSDDDNDDTGPDHGSYVHTPTMYLRQPIYRSQFIVLWETDGLTSAFMRKVCKLHLSSDTKSKNLFTIYQAKSVVISRSHCSTFF